jgi:tetratricopeptide (TPR) repeat protein
MADVWVQVMTRSDAERATLVGSIRPKMLEEDAVGCEVLVQRHPDHVELRNDAAVIYLALGRPARALAHFEAAARLEPRSASGYYNVGLALEALGRNAEAERAYLEALQQDPEHSRAHNNLANLMLSSGRIAEARRQYALAVGADPANAEARRNLGAVLMSAYEPDAAAIHFAEAIRLRPDWPPALVALAWLRAAYRDTSVRRPQEAIGLAEQAVRLAPGEATALDALAVAYAAAGSFEAAVATAGRAVDAAVRAGQPRLAGQIRDRLALFKRREPFVLP